MTISVFADMMTRKARLFSCGRDSPATSIQKRARRAWERIRAVAIVLGVDVLSLGVEVPAGSTGMSLAGVADRATTSPGLFHARKSVSGTVHTFRAASSWRNVQNQRACPLDDDLCETEPVAERVGHDAAVSCIWVDDEDVIHGYDLGLGG